MNEDIKTELADAYASQIKLELQLRNKDTMIKKLKESIENQRVIIKGLQLKILELMARIGELYKEFDNE